MQHMDKSKQILLTQKLLSSMQWFKIIQAYTITEILAFSKGWGDVRCKKGLDLKIKN
jgi:hypothetical protein